jgi:hypothetical protein
MSEKRKIVLLMAIPLVGFIAYTAIHRDPINPPEQVAADNAKYSTPTFDQPSKDESTVAAPASGQPCNLISQGDLIEWSRNRHPPYSDGSTGLPPSATRIGDIDGVNCKNYLDEFPALHADNEADTAAGYRDCYEIAWAADNPGYNVDAVPAPRLKNVLEQAGNAC